MDNLLMSVIIVFIITFILKIFNTIYQKSALKFIQTTADANKDYHLVKANVSYDKFKMVSKESLRLNSPIRVQDNFIDFLLENISQDETRLENNILMMNYGEDDE